MNFEITCFKIGFKNCILKICLFIFKIFVQSKHITGCNKISESFAVHNFSKKFGQTWSNFEKPQSLPRLANIDQRDSELRSNNEILLGK